MKIGIFSDVHGNIYAFEKIWKALKKESCDLYLFLGDICGYYYHQNEIIDILRGIDNLISIMGNHDAIFLRMLKNNNKIEKKYTEKYGKSNEMLKRKIKTYNLNFLKNLNKKYLIDDYGIALFHGSPWNHLNGYIYPTDSLSCFSNYNYNIVLLGHTHYPMDRISSGVRIVNPGSCGQPRDYNWPSYAILYLKTREVKIKRIEYNIRPLINDVVKAKEINSYLIDVLKRTKNV